MYRTVCLFVFFYLLANVSLYPDEIDYNKCGSMQDAIARETQEISMTHSTNHHELAQLYVSRGESYLLDEQYEKAVEDFQNANFQMGYCDNVDAVMVMAFRTAFGEVVCYDNLGMQEQTEQALHQLQILAVHSDCNDCAEHRPCHGMIQLSENKTHFRNLIKASTNVLNFQDKLVLCKRHKDKNESKQQETQQENRDSYDDILGPNQPPEPDWCEEVVTGVGRAMDAIACLAPSYTVKVTLIGIIEALITRGVKCCQTGNFWKACVAPITRKWREWKNNKENALPPNSQNLPLYVN